MPGEYTPDVKAVLRKNSLKECGLPVGQINIVIKGIPGFQTVSFSCNQPKGHLDLCRFETREVTVRRNGL